MPDKMIVKEVADFTRRPFAQALVKARETAEANIDFQLAGLDSPVSQAMRHAVSGGKGIRAFLVMESARIHRVPPSASIPAAAGIEALHAYSLVHDDLPCMDDDDMRRGQPTVHRKWDEATAVLAGDALQSLAFKLIALSRCPLERRFALIAGLAGAAGIRGMVGGQEMDIAAESADTPLTLEQITTLQAGKTGALISWSATAGAVMAGKEKSALWKYGEALGLAFQIADDVLDVEGDAETVGKAVGKDQGAGKATFVSLLGLDGAKSRAAEQVEQACSALTVYGEEAETLREAARFVISRRN